MADPCVVIATANPAKVAELRQLLAAVRVRFYSLRDVGSDIALAESGTTYAANAAEKALTIALRIGCAALADDSGLEVDALGGAPGVYSARFAGPAQDSAANVATLLERMQDVPDAARGAHFRCVLAVACPDRALLVVSGSCDGYILRQPRGDLGFGYDPVFAPLQCALSFAQLGAAEKDARSHRARACATIAPRLVDFLQQHASSWADCRLTS